MMHDVLHTEAGWAHTGGANLGAHTGLGARGRRRGTTLQGIQLILDCSNTHLESFRLIRLASHVTTPCSRYNSPPVMLMSTKLDARRPDGRQIF
jgi:hypothetical protein